jgi:hypothetical protein
MNLSRDFRMDWWILVLIGVVVGAGTGSVATYQIVKPPQIQQQPVVIVPNNSIKEEEIKVQKQLTKLDILEPLCTPEFIEKDQDGSLLCRELYCRVHATGGDKTSQKDCEAISNQLNKAALYRFCSLGAKDLPIEERLKSVNQCIELFDRRL